MKNKKILLPLIAFLLVFSTTSITLGLELHKKNTKQICNSTAKQENISKEQALKIAEETLKKYFDYDVKKEKLTVNCELISTSYKKCKNTWDITWHNNNYKRLALVSINPIDGKIISATIVDESKHITNKKTPISYEQAKNKSNEFFKKIGNNRIKPFKTSTTPKIKYNGVVYQIMYERIENNIKFPDDGEVVYIDAFTGKPLWYFYMYNDFKFENTKNIISENKACEVLKKQLNFKLEYNINYSTNTANLLYIPDTESCMELDAKSVTILNSNVTKPIVSKKDLNTIEKDNFYKKYKSVNHSQKLLSQNEAEVIINDTLKEIFKFTFKIKNLKYISNYNCTNEAAWSAEFYGLVDGKSQDIGEIIISAKTQAILLYSIDPEFKFSYEQPLTTLTLDDSYNKALDYIAKYYPNKIKDIKTEQINLDDSGNSIYFHFYRIENGIDCPIDSISISIDRQKGDLLGLDYNWSDNISFEPPKNIISKDKAKEIYLQKFKPKLMYVKGNDIDQKFRNQAKLIYTLEGYAHINAITGEVYSAN